MALIFDIQRFSTHDGDGVRTLIFFKGCPLKCSWCSNPESQSFGPSLFYDRKRCKSFGDCLALMPGAFSLNRDSKVEIRRDKIRDVTELRDICASKALTVSGQPFSLKELVEEIDKDVPFYQDQGGVTLSGGEPLAQDKDLDQLLQVLKKRSIPVFVETTLHVKWPLIQRSLAYVDTYLVDLKHRNAEKFHEFTGGDLSLVLQNLDRLASKGTQLIIRIPVVPGFNHSEAEMQVMIEYCSQVDGIREIHFLPYHSFGEEKYRMLGMDYEFAGLPSMKEKELEPYVTYAREKGFHTKIGG